MEQKLKELISERDKYKLCIINNPSLRDHFSIAVQEISEQIESISEKCPICGGTGCDQCGEIGYVLKIEKI